jgi:hypothetical protein
MSNKPKKSSVRHTRAIQRDQSKHQTGGPPAEAIEQRLEELIHPATYSQIELFQSMGLRARLLTLPVRMAFVVRLIGRPIGAVGEAGRVLNQEGMRWVSATPVSQAAVTQRLNSLPAVLFENVLKALLPKMATQWETRQRPLPAAVAFVQQRFSQVLVLDGSTLDALLRKTGWLRAAVTNPLAGRMAAVLDGVTRLPVQCWYEPDEQARDQRFWRGVLSRWVANCLLLFDSGFLNFEVFDQLTRDHVRNGDIST